MSESFCYGENHGRVLSSRSKVKLRCSFESAHKIALH